MGLTECAIVFACQEGTLSMQGSEVGGGVGKHWQDKEKQRSGREPSCNARMLCLPYDNVPEHTYRDRESLDQKRKRKAHQQRKDLEK